MEKHDGEEHDRRKWRGDRERERCIEMRSSTYDCRFLGASKLL